MSKLGIINLTQHVPTTEQVAEGVIEPDGDTKTAIRGLLTFNAAPSLDEIKQRAEELARLAAGEGFGVALIGGAPYLMSALEAALRERGVNPRYSFTERRSVEETQPDGSVRKTAVFVHTGWVEPPIG